MFFLFMTRWYIQYIINLLEEVSIPLISSSHYPPPVGSNHLWYLPVRKINIEPGGYLEGNRTEFKDTTKIIEFR